MRFLGLGGLRRVAFRGVALGCAALALAASAAPALAEYPVTTLATLIDRAQIEDLYRRTAEGTPHRPGRFHMLFTNPRIRVNGDTATADTVWTGIISDTPQSTPHFVEQGREHDELVKRGGRWYFKHRVITSDGGLPAMFEKTYKQR